MPEKIVHLEYVAIFRETIGAASESIATEANNASDLYDAIARKHNLPWTRQSIRPAINDRMASWSSALHHNDRVLFLPPSSGG